MLKKKFNWILSLSVVLSMFLFAVGCEEEIKLVNNLSVEANPPEGGIVEGGGQYEEGEEVTIAAVANEGYDFIHWIDGEDEIVSTESDFVYTMPDHAVTLIAKFILEDGITGTVTDIDGNEYKTVTIGGKEWMAENLRTTKYNDGTEIPSGLSDNDWAETSEGAYAVHPHADVEGIDSEAEMADAYGKAYNWYAVVDAKDLCPEGWHVPSEYEWTQFTDYLLDDYDDITSSNLGNKLKSCRQDGSPLGGECDTREHPRWNGHGTHYGTDDFGFSALPAGIREDNGAFADNIGFFAAWWTATGVGEEYAFVRSVIHDSGSFSDGGTEREAGLSIRCVRD